MIKTLVLVIKALWTLGGDFWLARRPLLEGFPPAA